MNRIRYFIPLIALILSGCAGKPELEMVGFRSESEVETESRIASLQSDSGTARAETTSDGQNGLAVYVCGAVKRPGVYFFSDGSRICDALEAAGGFSAEADREWLNLAELLADGQKLRVPTAEEAALLRTDKTEPEPGTDALPDGKLNLNTATREDLMGLPGIGEAKADAVVRYREEHGSFRSVEEIMQVSGIKDAVFSRIKDRLTV